MLTEQRALELVLEAFSQLGMTQSGYEARDFALFISARNVADVLELGTGAGGMMFLMDRVCRPGLRVSIDRPWSGRDPAMPDGQEVKFRKHVPDAREIFADIHDGQTVFKLEEFMQGRKFGLIFADADHSYAGAKMHFEMYGRHFLKRGGFFAMHDVANGHPCQRWWEAEIMPKYKTWLFTEPANQYGIGAAQIP